jgi:hypothetical protein
MQHADEHASALEGAGLSAAARLAVRVLALVHAAVGRVLGAHVRAHDVAELVPARAACVRALSPSRSMDAADALQHTYTTMASMWQDGCARSDQPGMCTWGGGEHDRERARLCPRALCATPLLC